jgi:hypothetical protein
MFRVTSSLFGGGSKVKIKAIHELPLEFFQHIVDYVVTDISDLSIRHVCRGFRDCAWKAMAAILGAHTTFDLLSIDSMMNLRAMAGHAELTKHVTSLTITSCYVPDDVPGCLYRTTRVLKKRSTPFKRSVE